MWNGSVSMKCHLTKLYVLLFKWTAAIVKSSQLHWSLEWFVRWGTRSIPRKPRISNETVRDVEVLLPGNCFIMGCQTYFPSNPPCTAFRLLLVILHLLFYCDYSYHYRHYFGENIMANSYHNSRYPATFELWYRDAEVLQLLLKLC